MLEHKCEVCGKMWRKKLKADGKVVCNKHYKQFKKYGFFRDNSPLTQRDSNKITIDGDKAYIHLYNKFYEEIAKAIIDVEDYDKVKNRKWRMSSSGYCVSSCGNHKNEFLHRVVLGTDHTVDHINENKLDNRKSNLRLCNKSTNQMNVKKYKGYYYIPEKNKWYAKIKLNGKQLNIAWFSSEDEAHYCRWYAEKILFDTFSASKEEPTLSEERKKDIQELVKRKVQRLQ